MAKAIMGRDRSVLDYTVSEPPLKIKKRLSQDLFDRLSDGKMDGYYWDDLRMGVTIDDTYWESRAGEGERFPF